MKLEKRLTVTLTQEQYDYIEKIAKEKYEGKFSQALRFLLDMLIRSED